MTSEDNLPASDRGRFSRRLVLFVATIAVVIAVAVLLVVRNRDGATGEPGGADRITYGMPVTIAAIPAYVARDKGFWKEEGLEVDVRMFTAGRLAVDALLAGEVQVMSVSETPLVHAIGQGADIAIVATVTAHQEAKFVGRADHGVRTIGDLRGRQVATLPGTNSDYLMYRLLERSGLSAKDLQILPMQPPEMVTALVNGNIDGYFAWEPHIHYAVQRLGDKAVVIPSGDAYEGRHCVAMKQKYVAGHPAQVEKLIRGLVRAERFVHEHPEESMQIVARASGLDEQTVKGLWREYDVRVVLGPKLFAILEREGRWVLTQKSDGAGALPDYSRHVYTDALAKVRPESVAADQ